MPGRYYEAFTVGETIRHDRRRTISEADNQRFCDLTMNQQPLHLDADFAADTQFGERVVNGLYTLSLAVGLTIPETTDGTIVANLGYDTIEHPAPVFHGDTIRAQSTVTDARETSDGERGVVTMTVEAFVVDPADDADADGSERGEDAASADRETNDDGEVLVCSFERTVLSEKRPDGED